MQGGLETEFGQVRERVVVRVSEDRSRERKGMRRSGEVR